MGQKAYQCVVPYAGPGDPTVRVLDGNAVFSADWYPSTTQVGPLPDGIFGGLIETLRRTMTSLRG
jgi:hypothetical protein